MNKIQSLEHAFEIMSLDINKMPDFSMASPRNQAALLAHYKLTVAIEAQNKINGDWEPDWSNSSQYKYYPWPWVNADREHPSGVGLSFGGCGDSHSYSVVGSRLCTFSRESAKHLFETFKELYESYYLYPQKEK